MVKCSQYGQHPHEMYPEHVTEGGVAELALIQYNPPQISRFNICKKCANELYESCNDERFEWIVSP